MTKHDADRGMHILTVIEDYTRTYGYPPSVREIGERVGLASTSATQHWIERLEREGRLTRDEARARSLRVVMERPVGVCQRPGCDHALPESTQERRWCSETCRTIAAHVRRWVHAAGADYLSAVLGL